MNKLLILVTEDDAPVRNLITTTLRANDYRYITAETGESAVAEAASRNPDIILLDLGLPDIDGEEVIGKIRSWSNVPIIVISARSEDSDKINALDAGADDYLTKPFAMKELLARVRAMTRRKTEYTKNDLSFNDVHLRAQTFELAAENSVRLSVKEFELMQLLMLHREHAVSVDYIMNQIWSREPDVQPDTVWLYISYLKRKLKAIASETVIEGDETQGYILK